MHAPNKILVPVDFTETSHAALEYAVVLAERLGAEVDLLHVWGPPAVPVDGPANENGDPAVRPAMSGDELLTSFAHSDYGPTMVEWLTECRRGGNTEPHGRLTAASSSDVPDAIVQAVQSGDYDLIVMGTNAHHPLAHFFRGSVSQKVLRRAPCPVITVHRDDASIVASTVTPTSWPSSPTLEPHDADPDLDATIEREIDRDTDRESEDPAIEPTGKLAGLS